VVQQSSDIVDEEGIQQLGDLFLVREIQRAIKWDPALGQQ